MNRFKRFLTQFLYPGIQLKRWLSLLALSAVVLAAGMSGILGQAFADRSFHIRPLRSVEREFREWWEAKRIMDKWLIVFGAFGMVFAVRRGYYAILAVYFPNRERSLIRVAYERARRRRAPHIAAVGGGTGLPNLLLGLKEYTENLTAVVTVADDSGSSGRLRRQFGMLPPGDLRNCLIALAEAEPTMSRLFQHRFTGKGELAGHAFGNLFLTAMAEVSGDFSRAVAESGRVLAVRGQVYPVTLDLVRLAARLRNGKTVVGESRIARGGSPIERVMLLPARPKANPDAVRALAKADIIVLGPGSLYTSVLPNLLVPGIRDAIVGTRALKVYVSNIMTEPGETDGFTAADHLAEIEKVLGPRVVRGIVVNDVPPPKRLLARYAREKSTLVPTDEDRLRAMGVRVVRADVLTTAGAYIRHDPAKLGRAVVRYAVI